MIRITALIVDDELPARKGIRKMLQQDSAIEILPDCRDGASAIESIRQNTPDIVFLDIQMPVMTGFDVLAALAPEEIPVIVFVTAYDQYAIQAFDVHAFDYILKPVQEERFRITLKRAKNRLSGPHSVDVRREYQELLDDLKKEKQLLQSMMKQETLADEERTIESLLVKSDNRLIPIKLDHIDWIEATGDFSTIHVHGSAYLVRETMSSLEKRLDGSKFLRIHRSTIINTDRIREMQPLFAGDYSVILIDGTKLILSRTRRDKFMKAFKLRK